MNPEKELTPREQLEVRLTALLMGELPAAEEKTLQAQIAADPALAALHGRLRNALELLREAKAFPDHPAPLTPLQLSSERRERLLAHFKTPAPGLSSTPAPAPIVALPRRDRSWMIPLGIAAALIVFLGAGLFINGGLLQRKEAVFGSVRPHVGAVRSVVVRKEAFQDPDRDSFSNEDQWISPLASKGASQRSSSAVGQVVSAAPYKGLQILNGQEENVSSSVALTSGAPTAFAPLTLTPPISASKGLAPNLPTYAYVNGGTMIPGGDSSIPADPPKISIGGAGDFNGETALPGVQQLVSGGQVKAGASSTDQSQKTPGSNIYLGQTVAVAPDSAPGSADAYSGGTTLNAGTLSVDSGFDLSARQPGQNEYQRYPGHPGTTSLGAPFSSVLGSENLYIIPPRLSLRDSFSSETVYSSRGDFDSGLGTFPDGSFAGKQDEKETIFQDSNVHVTGNTRTRDAVIKRELPLEPKDVFYGGGTAGTALATDAANFPFVAPGASPSGAADAAGSITSGNRSGNLGISANAIDALIFPTTPTGTAASGGAAGADASANAPAFDPPAAQPAPGVPPSRSKTSAEVEQVKQWFTEAQGFYDTGRYDLAQKRCDQILNVDHYNIAARRLQEKSDEKMSDYGVAAYDQTRTAAVAETDRAWQRPLRRSNTAVGDLAESDSQADSTKKIRQKLEHIIIPKLEFRDATVQEAIDFLKKKSVELDDASPAGEKGTNIVLKLPPAAEAEANAPAIPSIPGLKTPAAATATPAAAPATTAGNPQDARITVSLTNIPLVEALKYVTGLASMKFKVEPHAISVTPVTENTDVLVTKEWKIPPDLIPRVSGAGGSGKHAKETSAIADQESAKNWLSANGVTFNGAASAIYITRSHRLIVRNTEDQLDLVDTILDASTSPQAPGPAKTKQDEPVKKPAPDAAIPQPEMQTNINAFSTFSLNVSDVSFKLAAASLEQGKLPEPSSVRSEEFINAFDYHDSEAAPGAPLAFATERARYPFAQNRDLLRFAVKTAAAGREPGRPLNIVLLLDKSGSMERADRVNIVREALRVLTAQLQPQDKLSIVTFARTPRLWADGVAGDKAGEMIARVGEITPEGGTNLEAALDLGYATALRHYAAGNISRVVLFTDGAANLGDVNPEALEQKVEAHRKQGVALDCFGIGWEGYNDDLLEELTRHGDGRYGFINTPEEATANFAAQLAGALRVAAADVKVQVEFNPRRVTAYRQIGYAKHQLTKEQFRDNSVDAAQIGAEESGNALYVVEVNPRGEGDLATVRVRFKAPGTSDYREHEWAVPFTGNAEPLAQASPALRLAATAAAFSEMLAANPYAAEVTDDRLLGLINGVPAIYSTDPRPAKLEWMIRQAKSLSGR